MFGIRKLIKDVATIAVAPVVITVEAARVATKPLADVAEAVVETVADVTEDIREELSDKNAPS